MLNEMMPFLTALIAGLLIGIERERSKGHNEVTPIWGARTFPLLALTGVVVAFLNVPSLTIIIGIFVSLLILVGHVHWNRKESIWSVSATTAIAAILTFLLGFLAYTHNHISLILAVILFGFLALKARLHKFAQTGITQEEMRAALTFLISAFVILPLLPNDFIDPWQLIHPTRIWFLFVIIAGVEFSSYIVLRQLGTKWGLLITGLLGGFISATATTLSLAQRVKVQPDQVFLITSGIILAEVSSLLIQIVVLTVIAPSVASSLFLFLAIPALIGGISAISIAQWRQKAKSTSEVELKIKNPISLKRTATFALFISAGLILIALATRLFGEVGVYITSALGGAVSLRIVTFSASELASSGEILLQTASISILIAMMVNMLVKLGLVYKAGGSRLCFLCALFFSLMLGGGVLIYFIDFDFLIESLS